MKGVCLESTTVENWDALKVAYLDVTMGSLRAV
jgi:hypothetical protein